MNNENDTILQDQGSPTLKTLTDIVRLSLTGHADPLYADRLELARLILGGESESDRERLLVDVAMGLAEQKSTIPVFFFSYLKDALAFTKANSLAQTGSAEARAEALGDILRHFEKPSPDPLSESEETALALSYAVTAAKCLIPAGVFELACMLLICSLAEAEEESEA